MIARRGLLRAGLAAPLALPAALRAEAFAGTYAPEAEVIGDGIWLVRGADEALGLANGGAIANSVIIASDAGSIVVDSGPSLGFGRALEALARRVTGAPVVRVYITHLHPDHSFGSAAFAGAEIHALPGTRADLEREGAGLSDAMYRLLHGWMAGTEVVLPSAAAAEGEIALGGRRLSLFALSGHSAGDLALLDHHTGTLIAGDLVFHHRAPATPHAAIAPWLAALDRLEGVPHHQLVPGHGPLDRERAAIGQTRAWLVWLDAALRRAVAEGLDMSEAANLPIPPRLSGMAAARYELTRSVAHFYPRLEAELLPQINR